MRRIQVLILRLLSDPDSPDLLRGSIAPASGGEPRTFVNGQALLDLMRDMARDRENESPPPASPVSENNGFKEVT